MGWIWVADRATGIAALAMLVASSFTGIAYTGQAFGLVQRWSRAIHNPLSWALLVLVLLHGGIGAADTFLVTSGQSPVPGYGQAFLLAGVAVGTGALVLTVVAAMAFADPKRFQRPWKPGLVHTLAYAGFAFTLVHAAAIGTDVRDWAVQGLAVLGFLLAATVLFRRRGPRTPLGAPAKLPSPHRVARSVRPGRPGRE